MEGYLQRLFQALGQGGQALEGVDALMEQYDMVVPPSTRPFYGSLGKEQRSQE